MTYEQFMARLVHARRNSAISQAFVADALGVTQTAVSYWETGRREIGLREALAYADLVGLDIWSDPCPSHVEKRP
jgi:transcriptional regulator with XRE-family HTH domain